MRILILGSGAREHAIVLALREDPEQHEITVAPGNAGIAADAAVVRFAADDADAASEYAMQHGVDLVIIGPEAPLVAGVADVLRDRGIPVFGPGRAAARLEGSKAFAKRIMADARVPTGRAVRAATAAEATSALDGVVPPYVVKADGLAAGKGVLVTSDRAAATAHALTWLEHGPVLVEEFLDGQEVSLFFVCDGTRVVPLSPAQDFKRLLDGDAGPNTGGMGAYSPVPWLDAAFGTEAAFVDEVRRTVAEPVVALLDAEDTPFIGLLYCGLIVDGSRISVIEFNARFGDPETQVVLPRLATPFAPLLLAAAAGTLDAVPPPTFRPDAAVTVVLASEGYPESRRTGREITGTAAAERLGRVHVDHAATDVVHGRLIATGGRVLSVVGTGATVADARERAYAGVAVIDFAGAQHRSDIAAGIP